MCESCGCGLPATTDLSKQPDATTHAVAVMEKLLDANDIAADHNRAHLDASRVLAINLMSSPGAGKTSLLEATIDILRDEYRIAVIEGDLETENDANRIRAKGIPAVQISTGNACHLDAHVIHDALHRLDLTDLDLLFIENVGNLVCPAAFDLGQHRNAVLLSVPEGDDKPAKYPVMFRAADLLLLSKSDLLPVLADFEPALAIGHFRNLANAAPVMCVSARERASLDPWIEWLRGEIADERERVESLGRSGIEAHEHGFAGIPQ